MSARVVPARASAALDHRAYVVRAWPGGVVVADDKAGLVTVLDADLSVLARHRLGAPVTDISLSGDLAAWITGDELHVGDLATGRAVRSPVPDGTACAWTPDGDALWVAASVGDQAWVELRSRDGAALSRVEVPDPFGHSVLMLGPHPDPGRVVAWVAAGQDGQQSWLVSRTADGLAADLLPCDDRVPPVFGPGGDWFVAAGEDLVRRSWPGGELLGSLSFAELDPEADEHEDAPGADLRVLPDGRHAAWSSQNGRLHIVDLHGMRPAGEIAVEGHPVRTVVELYPTLTGDHAPCGDFDFAVPGPGDLVVTVHRQRTLVASRAADWAPET